MHGVTTRDAAVADAHREGTVFYTVKRVSGDVVDPRAGVVNGVACFGDTATVREEPDRVAVTSTGIRASSTRPEFNWDWVCPTDPAYREELLAVVERCVDLSPDLRLNTVGFPRESFCHCERCNRLFDGSAFDDRAAWRTHTVTRFVESVADRVPGDLYLTTHPDPYPGQLATRRGIDLASLESVVDGLVIPLCATTYETTYWLEIIARGFANCTQNPLTVQLSALDDTDQVDAAVAAVTPHADHVVFGGDADALEPLVPTQP